jgi:hypothetical protein
MRVFIAALSLLLVGVSAPAAAQGGSSSSWGVIGSFVPEWYVPSSLEPVAALHFSEDDLSIEAQNLRGSEFRIGVARGRTLSGDWGVSFVRKAYDDATQSAVMGGSCSGGTVNNSLVLQCEDLITDFTRSDNVLNGFEVHKYIPFVTIARRAQVGVNLAGGFGAVSGQVTLADSVVNYRRTFPPGVFPEFSGDQSGPFASCAGAPVTVLNTVPGSVTTDDAARLLKSESNWLPIGRAEVAVAVIVAPRVKLRVAGGLNYPGVNTISVTGLYLFGGD